MKEFIKSRVVKALALVIAALLAGSVIAIATDNNVSPISTVVGTVFKPVQTLAGKLSAKLGSFGSSFRSSQTLQAEIDRLNDTIRQYQKQLADYNEMQSKIESYEDVLELKEDNPDFKLSYASVIGTDTADAFSSVIIDAGESDGVKVNDPVVSGDCLFGVVKKVNKNYSVVQTILNPNVNISAMDSKTRETSYVTSSVNESRQGHCIFASLDRSTAVSPGGIIITSGIGGVFPKGLIIGVVSQVLESEYDVTSYAVVKPSVDFEDVEELFVITSFSGQGVAVVE